MVAYYLCIFDGVTSGPQKGYAKRADYRTHPYGAGALHLVLQRQQIIASWELFAGLSLHVQAASRLLGGAKRSKLPCSFTAFEPTVTVHTFFR